MGATVMLRSLGDLAVDAPAAGEARTDEWIDTYAAGSRIRPDQLSILDRLLKRIDLAHTFVSVPVDGVVAACGLGVLDGKTLWIFDVATRPEYRRRGLAKKMMHELFTWARANGAEEAALQVQLDNSVAKALYGSLGLEEVYEYRYRFKLFQ
jgi:ribosomal protein S18 acetylase RimI-like enzyme